MKKSKIRLYGMKKYIHKDFLLPVFVIVLLVIAVLLPLFALSHGHDMFYTISTFVALLLIAFGVAINIIFTSFYKQRNEGLRQEFQEMRKEVKNEVEAINKDVAYSRELFDTHFKVTDKTIVDTREERDRERTEKDKWMKIALGNAVTKKA